MAKKFALKEKSSTPKDWDDYWIVLDDRGKFWPYHTTAKNDSHALMRIAGVHNKNVGLVAGIGVHHKVHEMHRGSHARKLWKQHEAKVKSNRAKKQETNKATELHEQNLDLFVH
jgi:hypothetical protein